MALCAAAERLPASFVSRDVQHTEVGARQAYEEPEHTIHRVSAHVDSILFGLSAHGQVYFRDSAADAPWVPLEGLPCGMAWGTPVDVDASSTGIWVVCQKEFMTRSGTSRKEHFLFAKWGWTPENNHPWWHMMSSGNVTQLDADKDSVFGVDHSGAVLWRPAGGVNRHGRWHRFDGPPGVKMREILADSDDDATWLWGRDDAGRLWRRQCISQFGVSSADDSAWSLRDDDGVPLWPEKGPKLASIKNGGGLNWAVDAAGRVFWRPLQGCCDDRNSELEGQSDTPACWCLDANAPRLSHISDFGNHGIGRELPALFQRRSGQQGGWASRPHRWVSQLTSRMHGASQWKMPDASDFYASRCAAPSTGFDHCEALELSVQQLAEEWRTKVHQEWSIWDWSKLKEEYWKCRGRPEECEAPLKHFGAFREEFLHHAFCCARNRLTEDDPQCSGPDCRAYDMICPGSTLPTSDRDCTVYHSRDPGAHIVKMKAVSQEVLSQAARVSEPSLQVVFDANLFGTWTWIPDSIFERFPWPAESKALFEEATDSSGQSVWVLKRKCTVGSLDTAIQRFNQVVSGEPLRRHSEVDQDLVDRLRKFIAGFAHGTYGVGSMADWERIHKNFQQASTLQEEGYLAYPTLLENVGRRQAGILADFKKDGECARQVSFIEQATFAGTRARELPRTVTSQQLQEVVIRFLVDTGKYFDRMLDASPEEAASECFGGDQSTFLRVLEAKYGDPSPTCRLPPSSPNLIAGSTRISNEDTRMSSCLDVAMWGTAVRHTEAIRSDAGELGRPMVEAFFTCFAADVPFAGDQVALRSSVLNELKDWVRAIPALTPTRDISDAFALGGAAAAALALSAFTAAAVGLRLRRRQRSAQRSFRMPTP